jgi:glyoxylase-like metal-dependent hydrolase (beta-lactamase superfamily II)
MELLPGIHRVEGVTANVYLIVEADEVSVVDTGLPGSGARQILTYLRERLGREPGALRRILLTHQHADHVGGAAALQSAAGAAVVAHPLDTPAIAGKASRELPHPFLLRAAFRTVILPRLRPVAVSQQVEDGATLPVLAGEGGLQVVATPGHTAGHVSFYLPSRRLLFVGDAYVHRGGRIVSPPAMFTRDMAEARRSMERLSQLALDASLPGHGAPILHGAGTALADAIRRG